MKRLLKILLVIAIVAAPVNDIGRYLTARYALDNGTNAVVDAAITSIRTPGTGSNASGQAAVAAAQTAGIELYGYQTTGANVTVWTRILVEGTWVVGPYKAWRAGKPLKTPFSISTTLSQILQ